MRIRNWIAAIAISATAPVALPATEPEFRLLKQAESRYGDGAFDSVELIQFEEAAPEIAQPLDPGLTGISQQFASAAPLADDFSALMNMLEPRLASSESANLNTPTQIARQQELTGRADIGLAETAPVEIVPSSSFNLASVPDPTETIVNTSTVRSVNARKRSPIGFDPRIRGYYFGQTYTTLDGGFQSPVREDLDGVLSKIDPWLIGNVQVISGPYGLRYGSAFSFLNVDMIPTPRYECGPENHLRVGSHVRTNGGRTYNTATLYGGGSDAGYYVNTGYRKGSDYDAGDGLNIPSSYEAFNVLGAVGMDIDEDTRLVTRFNHVNEGNTEYAGQFFDVDDLKYYGITQSLIHDLDSCGLGYRIDTWFNDSSFDGDTTGAGKRRANFPVLQRVDLSLFLRDPNSQGVPPSDLSTLPQFIGDVDGNLATAGIRAGITRELDCCTTVGAGLDFRYVRQQINEAFNLSAFGQPSFFTNLPTAEVFEPGIYTEYKRGLTPYWTFAAGGRVAFATTQADASQVLATSNFRNSAGQIDRDLDQYNTLTSFYFTNDVELAPNWRTRVGLGYAERVPNLIDRYADGIYLAIIQDGFTRIIGNPELSKERNWQFDARIDADYEYVRGRLSGFHAWITDYATYNVNITPDPTSARVLSNLNTDLATITGFEAYAEADLATGLQCFASAAYLDGRDREIDQPLPQIYPLESRIGLRLVDPLPSNRWGLEWGWRIVDNQDRIASLRAAGTLAPGDPTVLPVESATPGFTTSYLQGYLRPNDRVSITGGIENLFDRNYYEHLDLRLPPQFGVFGNTFVLSTGFTPYLGIEVDY